MLKDTFIFQGPLGEIECVVEPNRSENNAVLVMAHGFRGSRDSGGRAAGVAQQAAAHAAVVRFNFTGTQIISRQVEELRAVLAEVRRRQPGCKLFLLGRSLGGAASIITAAQDGALAGLILWATPNNLRFTFRYVMTEDEYRRLDSGETLHFNDERGECDLTPDFLTDFDQYDLPALLQKRSLCLYFCCTAVRMRWCWQSRGSATPQPLARRQSCISLQAATTALRSTVSRQARC